MSGVPKLCLVCGEPASHRALILSEGWLCPEHAAQNARGGVSVVEIEAITGHMVDQ